MQMDWGTVPDWVSGVGGLLAVVAAVVSWRVSARLLAIEQRRDKKREESATRAQADLVFALGAKIPARSDEEAWSIFLVNASQKPIYDICIKSQRIGNGSANVPLRLGALPPGQFVIPSHPRYHWGALLDYSRTEEEVDLLVKGRGITMITSFEFTDANRVRWCREAGTEPPEVRHHS